MPRDKSTDHVILNFYTGYLECRRCGRWFDYNGKILPADLDFATEVMNAFGKVHRHCEQTERGKLLEAEAARLATKGEHFKHQEAERLGISWEEMKEKECWDQAGMRKLIDDFKRQSPIYSDI